MARTARKEAQLDHIRQEILRAAARAAAQNGFAGVTLRDIAKETGYTVGTLYKYFDSKEAIQNGLRQQLTDMVIGTLKVSVPAGLSFRQKVELLAQRQLAAVEDWRDGVFAMLMLLPGMATALEQDVTSDVVNGLVNWLKANATPEELGSSDYLEAALFYFGVLEVVVTVAKRRSFDGPFVHLLPRVMNLFFSGIGSPRGGANG